LRIHRRIELIKKRGKKKEKALRRERPHDCLRSYWRWNY